jgi:hypothetical protein
MSCVLALANSEMIGGQFSNKAGQPASLLSAKEWSLYVKGQTFIAIGEIVGAWLAKNNFFVAANLIVCQECILHRFIPDLNRRSSSN